MAGQLINRGERKWLVRIYLGRDVVTGKRKYHNKTVNGSKRDAQKYLNGVLREIDLGRYCEPQKMPLNAFLDKWLKDAVKTRVRDRTYHSYSDLMSNYVREGLGKKLISKITALEIQALYSALLERGLAVVTVQKVHTVLGSAFKQAVKWGFLGINPMNGVELPRDKGRREEKIKIIPLDRVPEFLEAASCSRWGVVFALALGTGMRPGEYLALKWDDVDFEKKLVRVQRTLYRHRKGGGWSFEAPKTKGSVRSISLPDELLEDLAEHREEQIRQFGEQQELIFASRNGEPLFSANLRRRHFKPLVRALGLDEGLNLYSMRHGHATLLLSAGVHPRLVADRLGHRSVKMTLDVYSHVVPSMQSEVAEQVSILLYRRD
jgi:integrase